MFKSKSSKIANETTVFPVTYFLLGRPFYFLIFDNNIYLELIVARIKNHNEADIFQRPKNAK